ncbi:D-alanyl-D-alanine carboxypeptidase family protein [Desulfosporosinus nitroreducens]|uniref:D-alanyl-D-alanine carboxypeptidase family protein n=1 Tax=Desulfosporosinus nitroreducens TaxID=2018668 RepID=UPI00207C3514|nr:serine hydrolase [Desulfosporosinus nitroreducens]MCO1600220.1 serine hydrolase [Desulfosporosinus nitroreducens]
MKHPEYRISKSKSKRKSRKVIKMTLLITVIVMSIIGFRYLSPAGANSLANSLITSIIDETQPSDSIKAGSSSAELSTDDESYVLIDPHTNKILRSHNADVQRAPASTLKLITGLVAVKNLKGTDIVKVGTEVNVEGSRLGLRPGDQISVHDLLTALYVNSSNDAAAALAVKAGGSIPAFAQQMNEYAASLGCQNTHFTNPHGLPDPNQYTSANDLSKISREFVNNDTLKEYVKQTNAHVQWKDAQGVSRESYVQNTNRLLEIYPGDQGLKTGTTTAAGQCLVSYVSRPDGDLLLVLLGSKERYRDTIKLLDEAWAEQRSKAALQGLADDPRSLILSPGIF